MFLNPGTRLPVARYRFTFRMQDELRLPDYAGSLLRGQFGAALRHTACITRAPVCPPCPLYRSCPYPAIFETPAPEQHALQRFSQVPNPYVIEPPALGLRRVPAGETLAFHVVLVGRALDQLPLIAYAFQRAFERGFGRLKANGRIEDIAVERGAPSPQPSSQRGEGAESGWGERVGPEQPTSQWEVGVNAESIWDPERSRIVPHEQSLAVPELPDVGAITLNISTPLRLQHQGHPVPPERLRPRTLLTAIIRRASLLFELHAGLPPVGAEASHLAAAADRLTDERRLEWKDWTRFSSRQQREMTLGGLVGEWTLAGELNELTPWLWLGQWLHAGKETTMGMGKYALAW